jgi:putative ABC transport system permease protein
MGRFDPFVRSEEEEEIRHHIAETVDALVAEGWNPEAARAEAERLFGRVAETRRELTALAFTSRLAMSVGFFASDVRYAVRGLWLNKTFTFAVVATLALGIGAASSIFAVVDGALWRPLPFKEIERWSQIWTVYEGNNRQLGLSRAKIESWRDATTDVFDAWVVSQPQRLILLNGARADERMAVAITPGAAGILGVPLLLGRDFGPEDARPGSPTVAILQRSYWEGLGSDPNVIGSMLRTDGGPVTVVGVLRYDGRVPIAYPSDMWIQLRDDFTASNRPVRAAQWLWARTPPGVAREAAQGRLDALAPALAVPDGRPSRLELDDVGSERVGDDMRNAMRMLAATLGAIYLIALLNGVNLLLVRRSVRARELTVRASLGASRGRIVRQLMTEGLVVGSLSGLVALALARVLIAALRGAAPVEFVAYVPFAIAFDARTAAFLLLTSVVAAMVLGVVPAIGRHRAMPAAIPTATDSARTRRTRGALVAAQMGISTVLLVAAVLFATSLIRLLRVDPGFDHDRLTTALLPPSMVRYPTAADRAELARRLDERLEALPEIASVSITAGSGFSFDLALEAEDMPPRVDQPTLLPFTSVDLDYFRTTGTRLVAGRAFQSGDVGTDNVIVDRDLARFLWSDIDPIGRRFRVFADDPWLTVVGMIEDVKLTGRDDRQGPAMLLRPRDPAAIGPMFQILARTEGAPELLIPLMERTLASLDPEEVFYQLRTANADLAFFEEKPRFLAGLMSALAGVGVLLAAVGLYGVLAYAVTRRYREIGIRVALGARAGRLRRCVLGEGLAVAGAGAAVGLAVAFTVSERIERSLYGVDPRDPVLFAATAGLLLAVAALASFLPAQRATRVDPIQVLKAE